MNTETLEKHPLDPMTDDSVGKWSVPHVSTSTAFAFALILENTKLKLDAEGQEDIEG